MFDFNTQIEIYQKYKLLQQTVTFNFSLNFPKKVCVLDGKKYSFFRKFGGLSFLETLVLRFALLPCYRRNNQRKLRQYNRIITLSHLGEKKYLLILIFAKSIPSTRLHTEISKRSFEVERKNNFIQKNSNNSNSSNKNALLKKS